MKAAAATTELLNWPIPNHIHIYSTYTVYISTVLIMNNDILYRHSKSYQKVCPWLCLEDPDRLLLTNLRPPEIFLVF